MKDSLQTFIFNSEELWKLDHYSNLTETLFKLVHVEEYALPLKPGALLSERTCSAMSGLPRRNSECVIFGNRFLEHLSGLFIMIWSQAY